MKYYYPNLLNNQNETAKNDIAWAADITEIELSENKKYQILHFLRFSFVTLTF